MTASEPKSPSEVREPRTTYPEPPAVAAGAEPAPPHAPGAVRLARQRRIVLPQEVTEFLRVKEGERIVYFFEPDGSIRLRSVRDVVGRLHGIFADQARPGVDEVGEFIKERHEEGRRDDERFDRLGL